MNLNQKTCATCSTFDFMRGCQASASPAEQSDAQQAQSRSSGPDGYCNDHQAKRENEEDTDTYALLNPLLIKSRWAATRSRSRKSME
jgi:hypothetical protein